MIYGSVEHRNRNCLAAGFNLVVNGTLVYDYHFNFKGSRMPRFLVITGKLQDCPENHTSNGFLMRDIVGRIDSSNVTIATSQRIRGCVTTSSFSSINPHSSSWFGVSDN